MCGHNWPDGVPFQLALADKDDHDPHPQQQEQDPQQQQERRASPSPEDPRQEGKGGGRRWPNSQNPSPTPSQDLPFGAQLVRAGSPVTAAALAVPPPPDPPMVQILAMMKECLQEITLVQQQVGMNRCEIMSSIAEIRHEQQLGFRALAAQLQDTPMGHNAAVTTVPQPQQFPPSPVQHQ